MNVGIKSLFGATALALSFVLVMEAGPAEAAKSQVAGSWKGGGRATGADGKTYRVRCKLRVQDHGKQKVYVSGKCSSQKGTAAGSATLTKKGSRYFGNGSGAAQFGNGRISMRPRGNRMSFSIRGSKGRLSVSLRKSR